MLLRLVAVTPQDKYALGCRLERAVAKLPKKDLQAVRKRFALLEVRQ